MDYIELGKLMDRAIITINGDMDFSSYTEEEKDWIYEYTIDYKPENWEVVLGALLK